MIPRLFRLRRRREEIRDTFTLVMEPAHDNQPVIFKPGQFTMMYVYGVGEIPVSISGDPAQPGLLVQTVRAVGAVSRALGQMPPGSMLGVRGPFGSAWPLVDGMGQDLLLGAGGLGMAPLRPVVYHVMTHRAAYGRVLLLIGARTPTDVLYRRELDDWRNRGIEAEVTVDRVPRGETGWAAHVGVITRLMEKATLHPERTLALLCGPEAMLHFSVIALLHRGFGADHIYLSLERNMKCAIGLCGHCQFGSVLACRDGAILRYDRVRDFFHKREI